MWGVCVGMKGQIRQRSPASEMLNIYRLGKSDTKKLQESNFDGKVEKERLLGVGRIISGSVSHLGLVCVLIFRRQGWRWRMIDASVGVSIKGSKQA